MTALDAYVYDAVRTPRGAGKDSGALRGVKPIDLLAPLYGALAARNPGAQGAVEDVVLGCSVQVEDQGRTSRRRRRSMRGGASRSRASR